LKIGALDHELKDEYQVTVKLDTLAGLVNSQKSQSTVKIHVLDVNDNTPEFVYQKINDKFFKPVYLAAISRDADLGSNVLTVKVEIYCAFLVLQSLNSCSPKWP
jgi:protocadherin-15